ncbi:MAG TPA: SDR family NAD(P)-dependent oxidoreductase, partial [Gemmatimonadales bacterium]
MKQQFSGKTVIVTGAAHGFGRAIAVAFAERGAKVWACDLLETELQETGRLAAAAGGPCTVRAVDVSDKAAVDRFVAEAAGKARVDILVNNAGGVLGQVGRALEEVTSEEWQ